MVDGARDAAACARQLGLAHLQIRGIQQSLFNDSEETLPEIQADDVKDAQRQLTRNTVALAESKAINQPTSGEGRVESSRGTSVGRVAHLRRWVQTGDRKL